MLEALSNKSRAHSVKSKALEDKVSKLQADLNSSEEYNNSLKVTAISIFGSICLDSFWEYLFHKDIQKKCAMADLNQSPHLLWLHHADK